MQKILTDILETIKKKNISEIMKKNNKVVLPGAIIILLLVTFLVIRIGANYHTGLHDEISTKLEHYKISAGSLARGGNILGELESVEARIKQLEAGLIRAKKAPVGAARLQSELKSLSEKRDITVVSVKVLPFHETEFYTKIPVEFQFRLKISQLKELLYDIQASPSLISVKGIRIKADNRLRDSSADELIVMLRVEGLMKRV
jgi:Tfp pilus assembly protein PilO